MSSSKFQVKKIVFLLRKLNLKLRITLWGGDDMAKKEIKVIIEGRITDNLKKDFNDRLAIALVDQYGIEGAKQILERLKAQ
jgi:hypothetical protein